MVALRGSFRPRLASTTGERFPGQPQTRTRAHRRVYRRPLSRGGRCARSRGERSSRREQADVLRAPALERRRAGRGRGPRREHVVHEQHPTRRRRPCPEPTLHGGEAPRPVPPGLRRAVVPLAREEWNHRQPEAPADDERERPRLVEAALGGSSTRERHPRDDLERRHGLGPGLGPGSRHRLTERLGHRSPAGELQPVNGRAHGAAESERGSSGGDRWRRAVPAGRAIARARRAAPPAPGRTERLDPSATSIAERPGPAPASRAPAGEHDPEDLLEHRSTLARAADTQGRGTSRAASAPRPRPFSSIRRMPCARRSG